jgi:hypothetical protein
MNLKILLLLLIGVPVLGQNQKIYTGFYPGFTRDFENTHSLALPDWGPYSKKYHGISHVADEKTGMRWDLSFHPGYHLRRHAFPASVMHESANHFWEAAPDLSYWACRYELEWKDQVYCDVSFSETGDGNRFIKAEFVNNTKLKQDLALNLFTNLNFPPLRPYSNQPIKELKVLLPEGAKWIDAID